METAIDYKQTFKQKVGKKVKQTMGVNPEDARLTLIYLFVSFLALLIGGFLGLIQGLERAGLIQMPSWFDYYQTLTAHGVLLILVFTTTFLVAYLYSGMSHTLGGLLLGVRRVGWAALGMLIIGIVLASTTILSGVGYGFCPVYPPMPASPWSYIGLVCIVVGRWVAAFGVFINVANRRRRHRGQHVPLFSDFAVGSFVLLLFGTRGVTY